jgi:hypothetical protein
MLTAMRGSLVGLPSFFLGDPFFSLDMWVLKLVGRMQCIYSCSFLREIKPADWGRKVLEEVTNTGVVQSPKVRNFQVKRTDLALKFNTLCVDK